MVGKLSGLERIGPGFCVANGPENYTTKQNNAALFDRNVESVKLDRCDYQPDSPTPWSFPLATKFPSGLDGEVMHSLFGLLYQQTMWEPYQQKNLRTWGLVRNSHALASPLPYVVYSDSYDARCYVRGTNWQGFSGLLWGRKCPDGGFSRRFLSSQLEVASFHDAVIDSWYIPIRRGINKPKEKRA